MRHYPVLPPPRCAFCFKPILSFGRRRKVHILRRRNWQELRAAQREWDLRQARRRAA